MNVIAWICRGLAQPKAVRALKALVSVHKPSLLFLSEVKFSSHSRISFLSKSLQLLSYEFIPANRTVGGVVLLWKSEIDVRILFSNHNLISALVFYEQQASPWHFIGVYGPPSYSLKWLFWQMLTDVALAFDGPWLVMGDFNTVFSQADKIGGRPIASSSSGGLQKLIADHGLINLGFHGHPFTWSNGRVGDANIQARLDRGYVNDTWRLRFPEATITHLPAIQSNHSPLLLKLHTAKAFHPRPFRFESMWTLEQSTIEVIRSAWNIPI